MGENRDNWLFLVDASVYIFRAWFSYPDDLLDADGRPANAVHGFATFLCQLLERARPRHIGVAFDESLASSFRNRIYPPYKANREPPPPALERQMKSCRRLAEAMGMANYASDIYEADDLIGSLAAQLRPHGFRTAIVSRDKDLSQLLVQGDLLWDFANDRKVHFEQVRERYGAEPGQIADLLALAGDAVDNIPGVPGIGRKSAEALLAAFGSLDGVYAHLDEVPGLSLRGAKRVQGLLAEHRDQAYLSRRLTEISLEALAAAAPASLQRRPADADALREFGAYHGFGPGLQRRCLGVAAVAA